MTLVFLDISSMSVYQTFKQYKIFIKIIFFDNIGTVLNKKFE